MRTVAPSSSRLRRRSLFGLGHFAKSLIWAFSDLLLVYYLHARLGVSGTELAFVLAPALMLAAGLDIGLGWGLRRISLRAILVLQAAAGAATGLASVSFFLQGGEALWALVGAMTAFRVSYAAYDVAHNALTSLLPLDEADANAYVTARTVLSSAARLCVAFLGLALVGESAPLAGWEAAAIVPMALLVLLTGVALMPVAALPNPNAEAGAPIVGVAPRGRAANDLAPILIAAFAHASAISLPARLVPFAEAGQLLLFAFVVGTLAGPFVANGLTASTSHLRAMFVLVLLTIIGASGLVVSSVPWAIVLVAVHGVGVGGTGLVLWKATSALLRARALDDGVRDDLWGFALLTASIKTGIGASMIVLPMLIGLPRFDAAGWSGAIALTGAAVFLTGMTRTAAHPAAPQAAVA